VVATKFRATLGPARRATSRDQAGCPASMPAVRWSRGRAIAYVRFHQPDHAEIGVVDVDNDARRVPFALDTGIAGGHPQWLRAPLELPAH